MEAQLSPEEIRAYLEELRLREYYNQTDDDQFIDDWMGNPNLKKLSTESLVAALREYGDNNQMDLTEAARKYQALWPTIEPLCNATCSIVHQSSIEEIRGIRKYRFKNTQKIEDRTFEDRALHRKGKIIGGFKFEHEHSVSDPCGTGFLVKGNCIITAAHNLWDKKRLEFRKAEEFVAVFRYHSNPGSGHTLDEDQVVKITGVVNKSYHPSPLRGEDWMVLEFEPTSPPPAPSPISLHRPAGARILNNTKIIVIGHPLGTALKLADKAEVRHQGGTAYFVSNPDTFEGNSGSPVFSIVNQTVQLEGMLVRGGNDFIYTVAGLRPVRVGDHEGRGEDVQICSGFHAYF